jgi:hypothetical protein
MTDVNDDLAAWRTDWQTAEPEADPSAPLVVFARRRRPLLIIWIAGELLVAVAGLLVVGYFFVVRRDPVERLAMGVLAMTCLSAGLFSWWNWRGAVRASSETTMVYLELTERRLLAMRRGVSAGWAILAVELLVLIPWTWYRLDGQGIAQTRAPIWPWVLIATMSGLGVAAILRTGRWVKREAEIVAGLRRDLDQTPPANGRDLTPPGGRNSPPPPAVTTRFGRARRRYHWRT